MNSSPGRIILPLMLAMATALPGLALAQKAAATPPAVQKADRTVRSMFAFADYNKDGQLTRAEAQGHLPFTYDNFQAIDVDKRGWINFEQFVAYTNKRTGKQADDIVRLGEWH